MNYLSMNQRIAAVKHYYKCNEQPTMAARRLAQEFDINPPQGRNIRLIVEKFEATGSVAGPLQRSPVVRKWQRM